MIWFHIPFDNTKNIGRYYNEAMKRLKDDEWCCFVDGDATFLSSNFGNQLQAVIDANPSYGLLYSTTNRIGCQWQQAGVDWNNNDIGYHRKIAVDRWVKFGTMVEKVNHHAEGGSGFFILISKKTWNRVGKFMEDGMLYVDWDYFQRSKNAGIQICLCHGLYIFHWYRGGRSNDTSHLQ